jgi:hypothetical protein
MAKRLGKNPVENMLYVQIFIMYDYITGFLQQWSDHDSDERRAIPAYNRTEGRTNLLGPNGRKRSLL